MIQVEDEHPWGGQCISEINFSGRETAFPFLVERHREKTDSCSVSVAKECQEQFAVRCKRGEEHRPVVLMEYVLGIKVEPVARYRRPASTTAQLTGQLS